MQPSWMPKPPQVLEQLEAVQEHRVQSLLGKCLICLPQGTSLPSNLTAVP